MTRLFGIIGHPLGHSLSPLVHNWGFGRFGIEAEYRAWPTPGPRNWPRSWPGCGPRPSRAQASPSRTRRRSWAFVDVVTDLGQAVGAINTLYWRDGALWGENTDVEGFCRPLVNRDVSPGAALVLGCGGAARAALVGLTRLGVPRVAVTGRTRRQGRDPGPGVRPGPRALGGPDRLSPADLLVNATPTGMAGRFEGVSPWPGEALAGGTVVYDLVYNPFRTPVGGGGQDCRLPDRAGNGDVSLPGRGAVPAVDRPGAARGGVAAAAHGSLVRGLTGRAGRDTPRRMDASVTGGSGFRCCAWPHE